MNNFKTKKAAMFGLDNQKKENCHPELGSGSHEVNAKHGAMFGLDARIALAIFGALSVISGAALYSAIQQSKVTATLADLNEIAKAFEAEYLDTNTALELNESTYYSTLGLVESSVLGWKGPYLNYVASTIYGGKMLNYPKINDVSIWVSKARTSNFLATSGTAASTDVGCPSEDDCSLYVTLMLTGSTGLTTLANDLDELVDNGDGLDKGKIRFYKYTSSVDDRLYYYIMPSKMYK